MTEENIEDLIQIISEEISDLSAYSGMKYDDIWERIKKNFETEC